jgi:Rrf2 family protein
MIHIARNGEEPVTSEAIALNESVSKKYLDGILRRLRTAGLLEAIKGQGGGYVLARPPWEISARDVAGVLEGGLEVVPCVDNPDACSKTANCPTRELWRSASAAMSETLEKVTLAKLAAWEPGMEPASTGYYI